MESSVHVSSVLLHWLDNWSWLAFVVVNPLSSLTTFQPKMLKYLILEKKLFWTYITVGSCSTIVF